MKSIPAAATFAVLLLTSVQAVADITMGVFPRRPPAVTHQAFQPLADKLSAELGEPVELVVPKDFKAFWQGVVDKRFDLVHYNQYHYVRSHKELGYEAIVANEEFGRARLAGTVAVRKDSGIESLEQLKGKTIVFGGGKKAMMAYVAPISLLKEAGLEPERDFTVRFAKNPPSGVMAAYNKMADAVGTADVVLEIPAVAKRIDTDAMTFLAKTKPLIHLPWAVAADMPEAKRERIKTAMLALNDSKETLKAAKVTAFQPVTDADYDEVREMIRFTTGEEY